MNKYHLALLIFFSAPGLQAGQIDLYGIPRVSEHIIDFTYDSDIDREIFVGKVLEHTRGKTDSYIRFIWSDDTFTSPAQEIRRELIRKEVPPDRIEMIYQNGGYSSKQEDISGIRLSVQNIALRLPECHYATQDYRYQHNDNSECAVTTNRALSLVNPYKMYF